MFSRSNTFKFALGHGIELASVVQTPSHKKAAHNNSSSKQNNLQQQKKTPLQQKSSTPTQSNINKIQKSCSEIVGLVANTKVSPAPSAVGLLPSTSTTVSLPSSLSSVSLTANSIAQQSTNLIKKVTEHLNNILSSSRSTADIKNIADLATTHTDSFTLQDTNQVLTTLINVLQFSNKMIAAAKANNDHALANLPHDEKFKLKCSRYLSSALATKENILSEMHRSKILRSIEDRFSFHLVNAANHEGGPDSYNRLLSAILFNLNVLSKMTNGKYNISDRGLVNILRAWKKEIYPTDVQSSTTVKISSKNNLSTPDLAKTLVVLGGIKLPKDRVSVQQGFCHLLLKDLANRFRDLDENENENNSNAKKQQQHQIKLKPDASASIVECAAHTALSGADANLLCEKLLTAKTIASMDLERVCNLFKSLLFWKDAPELVPTAVLEALTLRLNVSVPTTADEEELILSVFESVMKIDSFENWPQLVSALAQTTEPLMKTAIARRHREMAIVEKKLEKSAKNKRKMKREPSTSVWQNEDEVSQQDLIPADFRQAFFLNPDEGGDGGFIDSEIVPSQFSTAAQRAQTSEKFFSADHLITTLNKRSRIASSSSSLYTPPLTTEMKQMLFDLLFCELQLDVKKTELYGTSTSRKFQHQYSKLKIENAIEFLEHNPELFVSDPYLFQKMSSSINNSNDTYTATDVVPSSPPSGNLTVSDSENDRNSEIFFNNLASPFKFIRHLISCSASSIDSIPPRGICNLIRLLSKIETNVLVNHLCDVEENELSFIDQKIKTKLNIKTIEEFDNLMVAMMNIKSNNGDQKQVENNNEVDPKLLKEFIELRENKIQSARRRKQDNFLHSLLRSFATVAPSLPPRLFASTLESLFTIADNRVITHPNFLDEVTLEHLNSQLSHVDNVNKFSTPDIISVASAWAMLESCGNESVRPDAVAVMNVYSHVTYKLVPSPTAVSLIELPRLVRVMKDINALNSKLFSHMTKRFYDLIVGDVSTLNIGTGENVGGLLEKFSGSSSTVEAFSTHHFELYSVFDSLQVLGEEFLHSSYKGAKKFKDTWNLVREFVIEHGYKLDSVALVKAANAFGMLHSGDSAVFGVLARRLKTLLSVDDSLEAQSTEQQQQQQNNEEIAQLRSFFAQQLKTEAAAGLLLQLVNHTSAFELPKLEPITSLLIFILARADSKFEWYPNDAIVALDALVRFYSAIFDRPISSSKNQRNTSSTTAVIPQVVFAMWHRAFEVLRNVFSDALTTRSRILQAQQEEKEEKERQKRLEEEAAVAEEEKSPVSKAFDLLHDEQEQQKQMQTKNKTENELMIAMSNEPNLFANNRDFILDPQFEEAIRKVDTRTILNAATSLSASSLSEESIEFIMIQLLKISTAKQEAQQSADDMTMQKKDSNNNSSSADMSVDALACVVRLTQKHQERELMKLMKNKDGNNTGEKTVSSSPSEAYVDSVRLIAPFAVKLNSMTSQLVNPSSVSLAAHSLASVIDVCVVVPELENDNNQNAGNNNSDDDIGTGLLEWTTLNRLGKAAMRLFPEKY